MQRHASRRRLSFARFLTGRGLEIGALGNPMPLPHAEQVVYSDVLTAEQVEAMYPGSRPPDIVSDSEQFPAVPDGAFDFVVANHVLEHVTDPIGAIVEWHRITRADGLIFISLPDKRYTFDHTRPRTPLAHLIADHASDADPQQRNECHLLEWAEHVERLSPGSAAFEQWVAEQKRRGFAVHNHVWVLADILDLVAYTVKEKGLRLALVSWRDTNPFGNEFSLLLRKRDPGSGQRISLVRAVAVALTPWHAAISRLRRLRSRVRKGDGIDAD